MDLKNDERSACRPQSHRSPRRLLRPILAAGNLMAPGCAQGVRTRLDESQIRAARIQAATGRPYMGGGPIS